jgi:hypothetical protein
VFAVRHVVVGGALPPMWGAQAQHGIQPGPNRRSAKNSHCGPVAALDAQSTHDLSNAISGETVVYIP